MSKTNKTENCKTIEQLFSQVRNDVAVPSYGSFYAKMQTVEKSVTKSEGVRNTLRGWKLIPSLRMMVGVVMIAVIMLPVIYSHKASETSNPVLAAISEEGDHEIALIENEDILINYTLDQYLYQLETING